MIWVLLVRLPGRYTCLVCYSRFSNELRVNRTNIVTHLLFSIHPITFLLKPSVFAASNNLRCVPLSIWRCSTKLFKTAWPCARYESNWLFDSWIKVCSRNAWCSRAAYTGSGVVPRNGDSAGMDCCWFCVTRCLVPGGPNSSERCWTVFYGGGGEFKCERGMIALDSQLLLLVVLRNQIVIWVQDNLNETCEHA